MDSSSSSSSYPADDIWDHDVFLSFRGIDTRKSFTSHLHYELTLCGIRTFKDDEELPSGEDINPKLRQAIQRSRSSIIVFSQNYASSAWCLEELVEILECKRNRGQIVYPIYYDVEPSVLRYQTGKYAEAFQKHTSRGVDIHKVQKWRDALLKVADLKANVLANEENGDQTRFIHKIVGKVRDEVIARSSIVTESLIEASVDSNRNCINMLLSIGSNDVRIIGIYGMGGIGKSTISKAVYNEHVNKFQGSAVVENIKEVSKAADGLLLLQERLLRQLEKKKDVKINTSDEGINRIIKICESRKVLILLDDFDNVNQISKLGGQKSWFNAGSRVILVTRDAKLLKEAQVQHAYEMTLLNEEESLKLFMKNAIKEGEAPSKGQESLTRDIAKYCGGLPLALEVIGRYLRGENLLYWRNAMKEFQSKPHKTVQDQLKISYHALSKDNKAIFLDAACFFIGWKMEHLIKFWIGCRFPENSVRDLTDKCLFKIDAYNCLWMHDHLRDMGREIVLEASEGSLAKQSRLWIPDEVDDLLRNQIKEKVAAEGIHFDVSKLHTMTLDAKAFEVMHKLRFLLIDNVDVKVGGSFENVFRELRWLTWNKCPLYILPSDFHPTKLIRLDMQNSRIVKLWEGVKLLKYLKFVDLSNSEFLEETPDFTGTPSLEHLILNNCIRLRRIHPSICMLTSLVELQLDWCTSLKKLPELLGNMESLQFLTLVGCQKLKTLPTSICNLKALQTLILVCCSELECLPDELGNLECLQQLILQQCSNLKKLPEGFGNLRSLMALDASHTKLEGLPKSIRHLTSLVELNLNGCTDFETLPDGICDLLSLQVLNISACSQLEKLPDQLGNMVCLRKFKAQDIGCRQLPDSVSNLKKLECFSFSPTDPQSSDSNRVVVPLQSSLKKLTLKDCALCDEDIPHVIGVSSLLSLTSLDLKGNHFCNPSSHTCRLTNLIHLNLSDCESLVSLCELPSNLTKLNLSGCCSLASLSQLPPNLTELNLSGCISLVSLSQLPPNLTKLDLHDCKSLVSLPELPPNLTELSLCGCSSLASLSQIPPNLTKLNLGTCKKLVSLSDLPPNLTELNLSGCSSLVSLSQLPPNLTELELRDCTNLVSLPELPPNLTELSLSDCSSLASLSQLSSSLTKLDLSGCSSLLSLSQLPPNLTELSLSDCSSLASLSQLSSSLTKLDLSGCSSLSSLSQLPPTLTELNVSGCISLVSLSELPPTLKVINARGCTIMKVIPNLWNLQLLQELDLTDCNSLVELQGLEKLNIRRLKLAGCSNLAMNSILNERLFQKYFEGSHRYGYITFPKWKYPDWMMYQSMESTISFQLPSSLPDKFKGIILWVNVDSDSNDIDSDPDPFFSVSADISNNTSGKNRNCSLDTNSRMPYSWVSVIRTEVCKAVDIGESNLYFRSGDSITISIRVDSIMGSVEVESFGVHWLIGTEGSEAVDYINLTENDHNLESYGIHWLIGTEDNEAVDYINSTENDDNLERSYDSDDQNSETNRKNSKLKMFFIISLVGGLIIKAITNTRSRTK